MKLTLADYLYGAFFLVFFASIMFYNKWNYAGYLMGVSGIGAITIAALADKINKLSDKDNGEEGKAL